jgi:hypothetical protein
LAKARLLEINITAANKTTQFLIITLTFIYISPFWVNSILLSSYKSPFGLFACNRLDTLWPQGC